MNSQQLDQLTKNLINQIGKESLDTGDNYLKPFSKIISFTNDLSSEFSKTQPSIVAYYKLLKNIKFSNTIAIKKQVTLFKSYLLNNKEAIFNNTASKLNDDKILFSDKVYIDIKACIKNSDKNTHKAILKHLQVIYTSIFGDISSSSSSSSSSIKQQQQQKSTNSKELTQMLTEGIEANETTNNILGSFINNLDNSYANSNPQETFSKLFSDVISNVTKADNEGKLDIKNLLGSVKGIMNNIKQKSEIDIENDPEIEPVNKLFDKLISKAETNEDDMDENLFDELKSTFQEAGIGDISQMLSGITGGAVDNTTSSLINTGISTMLEGNDTEKLLKELTKSTHDLSLD